MGGVASFACEGVTRHDIAVLRFGIEGRCSQTGREGDGTSSLAHRPVALADHVIEMSSRGITWIAGRGRRTVGMKADDKYAA
jgi:hypothetical protein